MLISAIPSSMLLCKSEWKFSWFLRVLQTSQAIKASSLSLCCAKSFAWSLEWFPLAEAKYTCSKCFVNSWQNELIYSILSFNWSITFSLLLTSIVLCREFENKKSLDKKQLDFALGLFDAGYSIKRIAEMMGEGGADYETFRKKFYRYRKRNTP